MIPQFRAFFDAARDPAAARNALGLGEPAVWTPTLTFATPGDLSVAYTTRLGAHIKLGGLVVAFFNILTSSFTHTTASGNLQITGLPYTSKTLSGQLYFGSALWAGITKAGFTQIVPDVGSGTTTILFFGSASGSAISLVVAADVPTGGTVNLRGVVAYLV